MFRSLIPLLAALVVCGSVAAEDASTKRCVLRSELVEALTSLSERADNAIDEDLVRQGRLPQTAAERQQSLEEFLSEALEITGRRYVIVDSWDQCPEGVEQVPMQSGDN